MCAVCAFVATVVGTRGLAHAARRAGLRRDGRLPAGGRAQGPGAATATRVRGGVAGGGGQPGLRRTRGDVAARGARRALRAWARAAAGRLRRVRAGLPGQWPLRRLARPAQGPARRPRGRPGGGEPARRARGRWRRSRSAAAQPLRLPARRRAHPLRARGAPGVDGQRRPARGGGALAGAAADVLPARGDPALLHGRRRGGPRRRCRAVCDRLPRDGPDRTAARPSGGSSRDRRSSVGCSVPRWPGCLAGRDGRAGRPAYAAGGAGAALRARPAASGLPAGAGLVVQRVRRDLRPGAGRGRPRRRARARRCSLRATPAAAGGSRDGRRAVPRRAGHLGSGRVRGRRGARPPWSRHRHPSGRCRS